MIRPANKMIKVGAIAAIVLPMMKLIMMANNKFFRLNFVVSVVKIGAPNMTPIA